MGSVVPPGLIENAPWFVGREVARTLREAPSGTGGPGWRTGAPFGEAPTRARSPRRATFFAGLGSREVVARSLDATVTMAKGGRSVLRCVPKRRGRCESPGMTSGEGQEGLAKVGEGAAAPEHGERAHRTGRASKSSGSRTGQPRARRSSGSSATRSVSVKPRCGCTRSGDDTGEPVGPTIWLVCFLRSRGAVRVLARRR